MSAKTTVLLTRSMMTLLRVRWQPATRAHPRDWSQLSVAALKGLSPPRGVPRRRAGGGASRLAAERHAMLDALVTR